MTHHVVPLKVYIGTFIGLLVLTAVTIVSVQFDFGKFNIVLAMMIATTKASLVVLYFMGMRWESGLIRLIFLSTLLFFGIFFAFTYFDVATRGDINIEEKDIYGIESPVKIIDKPVTH